MGLGGVSWGVSVLGQTNDHAPSALKSADELKHDKKESWTYIKPGLALAKYDAIQIVPTVVYQGTDAQFDSIPMAEREKFAGILTEALKEKMAKSFKVVGAPASDAMRLKFTIVGATKTTTGVGTVSSVMPIGALTNAYKSITGQKGSFSGSVLLAFELFDSKTGELLAAAVRREAPDALDITATLSTTDTVKAVASAVADKLRARLVAAKSPAPEGR
ncbi:DUF3313 domain-containing protein [Novosphingobium sp. AP12]|uniref:DUF3313 domain-containing protein n=1 Tax=Novosphingobium sp. AP12 TaxID=1144305 RepID=UPI001EE649D0|nr:DUF3313 domain-containing protein [Novosphingobium sp. AP12]